MSELEVIRVEPLELPHDIVWYISGKYHISMKDFYVYIHETKGVMYVIKLCLLPVYYVLKFKAIADNLCQR